VHRLCPHTRGAALTPPGVTLIRMVVVGFSRNLLRPSAGRESSRVSFIELFFDLVFVFAVTQVSHVLVDHTNATALLHTVILTAAVWLVWINTTWALNWLNPELGWVRGLIIVLMLLGLLVSTAIPEAFAGRAMLFAGALVLMELGRTVFTALAFARFRPDHAMNFVRITVWLAASSVFWIWGAFVSPDLQVWFWLAAIATYTAGPPVRFWVPGMGSSQMDSWDISGEHMAERVGLFFILALGESILVTGSSFSEGTINGTNIFALVTAFTSTVLLWLLYFNHSQRGGSEYLMRAAQPGAVARLAYTYIPLIMVLGVVLAAVSEALMMKDPSGPVSAWAAGLACGSFAVYMIGNALFRRAVGGKWLISHALGALALVALFPLHPLLSALQLGWLVNGVTILVVIADEVVWRRRPTAGVHRMTKRAV
jgi:low temperature requirement protein LtrA